MVAAFGGSWYGDDVGLLASPDCPSEGQGRVRVGGSGLCLRDSRILGCGRVEAAKLSAVAAVCFSMVAGGVFLVLDRAL